MNPIFRAASTWRAYHFQYAEPLGFILCTIPKNAHRTVKQFLLDAQGIDHDGLNETRMIELCDKHTCITRIPLADRMKLFESNPVLVISRDPHERIASAFADKLVQGHGWNHSQPYFRDLIGKDGDPDRGVTFREFVYRICKQHPETCDPHWMPQSLYVQGLDVQVIGDVSDMQGTLANISERFDLPISQTRNKERVATQPWQGEMLYDVPSGELHRRGILPPASSLFIARFRDMITDAYTSDIELSKRGLASLRQRGAA